MFVVNNDQAIMVGWRYENPQLKLLLNACGISEEQAREMNEPAILSKVNEGVSEEKKVKCLPKPLITHCILRDDEKVLGTERVIKHKNDPFDKDKARRYSLTKVLHKVYPGPVNKGIRKKFWEAYIKMRGLVPEPSVVSA